MDISLQFIRIIVCFAFRFWINVEFIIKLLRSRETEKIRSAVGVEVKRISLKCASRC